MSTDSETRHLAVGQWDWRLISASVTGTSHEKRQQPCQDAHYWELLPNGVLAAAVADGAGSAPLAEVGAEIAVATAVQTISQQTAILPTDDEGWKQVLLKALKAAKTAVEAEAAARQAAARDLAATLIIVVATSELAAATQVGDGAAVMGDEAGNIGALTVPQSGEHINETTFLISAEAVETAQVQIWHGKPKHLAIFSDGLQLLALKMPQGVPHPPFFMPLFRFMGEVADEKEAKAQLESFLRSPRVTERTDDDLTLVLATLNPSDAS